VPPKFASQRQGSIPWHNQTQGLVREASIA
jgi:hypothetical protein